MKSSTAPKSIPKYHHHSTYGDWVYAAKIGKQMEKSEGRKFFIKSAHADNELFGRRDYRLFVTKPHIVRVRK